MLVDAPKPLRDRWIGAALRVRRAVLARRRPLAGALAGLAVLLGLHSATASPPATVPVTVAAHDLPAGVRLTAADVRTVGFAAGTAPAGGIRDPVGRLLAGPVRRGEPLTDASLVGPALTAGRPGLTLVPVRFPDAAMVGLLTVGTRVDVLAADPQGGAPEVVATDCPVLALPVLGTGSDAGSGATGLPGSADGGRLVVLGVPDALVTAVAGASVTRYLTFSFTPVVH